MRFLKQKAEERRQRLAELNELEELHKSVENALYDALRHCRYRLPHHRKDVVWLNPKIYTQSVIDEEELDRTFDILDECVAERKKQFMEARNAIYRT